MGKVSAHSPIKSIKILPLHARQGKRAGSGNSWKATGPLVQPICAMSKTSENVEGSPAKVNPNVAKLKEPHPVSVIEQYFEYDHENGGARWKVTRKGYRGSVYARAGDPAGSLIQKGYMVTSLTHEGVKKMIYIHRLVWALHHGQWPEEELDHRDGDKTHNKIDNLRLASRGEQTWNRLTPNNNTSGAKGVSWHKVQQRWVARITANGKRYSLGYHDTVESAAAAYQEASMRLHGDFSKFIPALSTGHSRRARNTAAVSPVSTSCPRRWSAWSGPGGGRPGARPISGA